MAFELRKLHARFPNTVKIIFDQKGLGDSFPQFLSQPWLDPVTNKEHPPLVCDNEHTYIANAMSILRSVQANPMVNQKMVNDLRVALEQKTIEFPIDSRLMRQTMKSNIEVVAEDEVEPGNSLKNLTLQEQAIFIETDALIIELSSVVPKTTPSGTIIFDTSKSSQHKDRYSSLAMGVSYIADLELEAKKKLAYRKDAYIGFASKYDKHSTKTNRPYNSGKRKW